MMTRGIDVAASLLGILVLSPFLILTALAVKLSDFGPVIFTQARVGRGGRIFRMWKFRSMRVNAERMGPLVTADRDPRVTAVGRYLRKYKLDEFPQLWNVVKGEMSLVGPRPEVESYVKHYAHDERVVLDLKPGITDPASFAFYDESELLATAPDPEAFYIRRVMPAKIKVNLAYAARRTILTDLLLIVATVVKPMGVDVDVFKRLGLANPRESLA